MDIQNLEYVKPLLPEEIIRHIFKFVLDENPFDIFNIYSFFKSAHYEDKEKQELFLQCAKNNYFKTNIPLINCIIKFSNNVDSNNFLEIFELIKPILTVDNLKYFYSDYTFSYYHSCSKFRFIDLNFIKFLSQIDSRFLLNCENYFLLSISINDFETLKWLEEKESKDEHYTYAIINKKIEMLEWLLSTNDSSKKKNIFFTTIATSNNSLEELKWLILNGFSWDENTHCNLANLEMIQFLKSKSLKFIGINFNL